MGGKLSMKGILEIQPTKPLYLVRPLNKFLREDPLHNSLQLPEELHTQNTLRPPSAPGQPNNSVTVTHTEPLDSAGARATHQTKQRAPQVTTLLVALGQPTSAQ